ncbi:MAG: ABC transporter substrate-binding protein [Dethiobacter sp.]|nr:ABC transporter substrate-binding protein [Dethiobacter sp.]MCL5982370.1 ABC transporter substrate-binding protein [Bacillota bacterium]
MFRKFWRQMLLAALLPAVLLAGGCPRRQEPTKVRLNEVTRSVFFAPLYAAINSGFFAKEGIELELTTGQGADRVMTSLLAGHSDIGFMGPEATIYVFNQGQQDYVVNFAQLTKRDGSFLLSREADPDFTWQQVKGREIIGGRPGGMPLMTLMYVLRNQGIDPAQDLTLITNIQFAMMAGAFAGGEGDYVTLFEPVATTMEQQGQGFVVASVGQYSGEIPYTVFSARQSFIENNKPLVQKFTNAIYRGQLWVANSTPEEVATAIKPFFPDADLALLQAVVRRYQEIDAWAAAPLFTAEAFNRLQDVMEQAGQLQQRAPYEKLVTNYFAEQAVRNIRP